MQIDLLKAKEASIDITMPTIMNTRATTLAPDEDTTVQLITSQETTTNIAPIVENIGKQKLMSKILDALGHSINHPMKDQVLEKLKLEFAPSTTTQKPESSSVPPIQIMSMPRTVRISKELKVNNTLLGLDGRMIGKVPESVEYEFEENLD